MIVTHFHLIFLVTSVAAAIVQDTKSATDRLIRSLVAAPPYKHLQGRSVEVPSLLKTDHVLHFKESNLPLLESKSSLEAQVHVKAEHPVLNIEELEPWTASISCDFPRLTINFHTHDAQNAVTTWLRTTEDLLIITSHDGCNVNGERKPFRFAPTSNP